MDNRALCTMRALSRTGAALTLPNAIVNALKKKTTGLRELVLFTTRGPRFKYTSLSDLVIRSNSLIIHVDTLRSHERQLELHRLQRQILKVDVCSRRCFFGIGNGFRLSDQDAVDDLSLVGAHTVREPRFAILTHGPVPAMRRYQTSRTHTMRIRSPHPAQSSWPATTAWHI